MRHTPQAKAHTHNKYTIVNAQITGKQCDTRGTCRLRHLFCDDEVRGNVCRVLVDKEHIYPDEQTVRVCMNV